jgi:hypothetical protein
LVASVYRVVPRDLLASSNDEPTEKERKDNLRKQLVDNISEILGAMLYAQEGRDKAFESGRRLIPDDKFGSITVVDTKLNQKKVSDYIAQLPYGEGTTYKIFKIRHVDPNELRNSIMQVVQQMRGGVGGIGVGAAPKFTITSGSGNGITYNDIYIELVRLSGDTNNPSAEIYWRTPTRDGDQTLTRGQSIQADVYRIRMTDANFQRNEIEVEIWQITGPGYGGPYGPGSGLGNYGAPGVGPGLNQLGSPATPPAQQGRIALQVEQQTNSLIVFVENREDLSILEDLILQLDVPILQVSIEAKFVEISETLAKKLGFDWIIPSLSHIGSLRPIGDELRFGGEADYVDPVFGNQLIGGNVLFQYVSKGGISAVLQTMEAKGAANTISAPRITVVNQQAASMSFIRTIPWVSIEWQTQSPIGVTTVLNWTFSQVSITLAVTPTVHEDGSIILDITPTVQQLQGRVPVMQGASYFSQNVGLLRGLENVFTRDLLTTDALGQPLIDTRTLNTRARVRSGDTIVLGGLIQERQHTAESKVPFLGSIPVLKYFFKKNIDYTEKSRLFIFLTATLVE